MRRWWQWWRTCDFGWCVGGNDNDGYGENDDDGDCVFKGVVNTYLCSGGSNDGILVLVVVVAVMIAVGITGALCLFSSKEIVIMALEIGEGHVTVMLVTASVINVCGDVVSGSGGLII